MIAFRALACDYDGTLAHHDRMDPPVLTALGRARETGLRLILVTGRTFFELTRVCDRLDLFDAVVAENGGVLYSPESGSVLDQAPPPPPRLLAELDRREIPYQAGRVVVGTARAHEAVVRAALAATGTGHRIVYNRAALMLLPPGISKATGVAHVTRRLGLSLHDVLALGDSENDLELFETCGASACPGDAIPEIRARADWVFPGTDGAAIARAIEGPILGRTLSLPGSPRHRLELGWTRETTEPVSLPARGVNVLIQGDPLSGKSWFAGGLIERFVSRHQAVAVIDPEGDYRVLAELPGIEGVEGRARGAARQLAGRFARDPAACAILDLSALSHPDKVALIGHALGELREVRDRLGLPHWIVLDEAHYLLHPDGIADGLIGWEQKGFCLVTYRPSWLRRSALAAMDAMILARTTWTEELGFLEHALPEPPWPTAGILATLPRLPRGEFVLVQPGGGPAPTALTFVATPRETRHVRHLRKYADTRVAADLRFLFRRPDGHLVASADSLASFCATLQGLPDEVIGHHAEHRDFSRWVRDVFSDGPLAAELRKTEARWQRGEVGDLRHAIDQLIAVRYQTAP